MRRVFPVLGLLGATLLASATAASASTYSVAGPTLAPDHPFTPSMTCPNDPGPPSTGAVRVNYNGAEVEPFIGVNPSDSTNIVAFFQQDRWTNGGAHGLVADVSHDGGASWSTTWPAFSRCTGGTLANGGYFDRSSDPWISFSPNGYVWTIAIAVDASDTRNAVLASRSTNGGDSWSDPFTLKFDTSPKVGLPQGNNFNDKESITADPGDSNLVYAVWDRIVSPSETAPEIAFLRARSYHGPTWFARSTNAASASPSFETARPIYDPGAQNQTISNQIVVLPNGTLVDGFVLLQKHKNNHGRRGASIAVIRSTDKGVTWSKHPIIISPLGSVGVRDPEPKHCRPFAAGDPLCTALRTGDIIPDFAVDRNPASDGYGNIYAVWQSHEFSSLGDDTIFLSRSTNGGLSWSTPIKVNQTPSTAYNPQAYTASVDVAKNGDVGVTYYDQQNDVQGDDELSTDYWLVHSHDQGQTFSDPASRLTGSSSFDMRAAPYARGYFTGDYEALAHSYADNTLKAFFDVGVGTGSAIWSDPNANHTDNMFASAG